MKKILKIFKRVAEDSRDVVGTCSGQQYRQTYVHVNFKHAWTHKLS